MTQDRQLSFYIKTYGCQMNVHDSLRIANVMKGGGFVETFDNTEADILIFNTCSVRANAKNKVLSYIGKIAKEIRKGDRSEVIVALGGCVGAKDGKVLSKENSIIDIIFGPDQISRLPRLINRHIIDKCKVLDIEFEPDINYPLDEIKNPHEDGLIPPGTSYVTIVKGCNNFCSYCIVPFTRGRERSRRIIEIADEIVLNLENGVKEVTLLGQNVNSFGLDTGESFVELLKVVDSLGVERLRFMTSHPKDISDECIDMFFELKSLCPFLHLPVQSGSDRILKIMNRKYDVQRYLSIIKKFRARDPNFAFGTDIIVGFPGETEEDFSRTLNILEEVEFETLFSFKYSKRPGTSAYSMPDMVGTEEKEKRLHKLNDLHRKIIFEKSRKYIGQISEVLVESKSKYGIGLIGGRSSEGRYINFEGDSSLIGKIVKVKISSFSESTYKGKLLT